ncbi:Imm1 family immunity protein [Streptomyces sp. NPDC101178]|uniref:Imm1 family immunity protein n=1 Tax=Streptomyces sp. NPDC101178 TaxID=3366124 RepID=UPI0037FA2794
MNQNRVHAFYKAQHVREPDVIDSVEGVDAMIDSLAFGEEFESMAVLHSQQRGLLPSGFPDHEFMVGVNGKRQVGILSFTDDANYLSLGSRPNGEGEVTYHIAENPTEFPVSAEIPLSLVRDAAREFLLSGGRRPVCVEWQDEPEV